MGKKGRPAIHPSAPDPAEDDIDDDAAAEAAALAELEAERLAEEAELEYFQGQGDGNEDGSNGEGGPGGVYNKAGLEASTTDLESRDLPWLERLDIVAAPRADAIDVHDDLARELAFYETALAAVKNGREHLKDAGVGWKRPEDFFCEMIKSDVHMARVKDRLIFEQHKMDAFEQRKQRQLQSKFAKAKATDLEKEKAAAKKDTIAKVTKWRKDNAERRKNGLADGDAELDNLLAKSGGGGARGKGEKPEASKRRQGLDKKYGHGGQKNAKFSRNEKEQKSKLPQDFSPKAAKFAFSGKGGGKGGGGKGGGKGGGNGGGGKGGGQRKGKAARDSKRGGNRASPY